MKKQLFALVLLSSLIAMIGCNNKPSATTDKTTDSTKITATVTDDNDCRQAEDHISRVVCPAEIAAEDINEYDRLCRKYFKEPPIESYTIRAVDLLAAMGMPPELADSSICAFKHVRVYMGYRKKVGFKLYIVPVADACLQGKDPQKWDAGIDIKLSKNGDPLLQPLRPENPADTSGAHGEPDYVLDLNAPCPNTCPRGITLKEYHRP